MNPATCVNADKTEFEKLDLFLKNTTYKIEVEKNLHQSTAASTWRYGLRSHLGWVEMAIGLPEGPSYPGHSPRTNPFLPCCSLTKRRRAVHSFFKIGRLSSLFSCHYLAHLCLFILFLMSKNVHPNPGPIFSCSVCAGTVTWFGKSVQCCTCFKWFHLKC